jgi:hypothetical protein
MTDWTGSASMSMKRMLIGIMGRHYKPSLTSLANTLETHLHNEIPTLLSLKEYDWWNHWEALLYRQAFVGEPSFNI